MRHQKNVKRIIACVLCAVAVVALLPAGALAAGPCTFRYQYTEIVCGKATTREVVSDSGYCTATHYYYNEVFGEIARCDYIYRDTTEADICPVGHWNNAVSYHNEYDHACWYAGR